MSSPQRFNSLWFGFFCSFAATLIWSTNFVLARGVHQLLPPVTLAFLRWSVALLVLSPFALRPLRQQWSLCRKNLGFLSLCGLFSVTLYNTLIYIAAHTTEAANLAVINESTPLFIILFAWIFLREKMTALKGLGVILASAGVLLLVSRGQLGNLIQLRLHWGDLWVLGAAFIFALYSILLKKRPAEMDLPVFVLATFALGWLFLLPLYLWEAAVTPAVSASLPLVSVVIYLGIGPSIIAYFAWARAIELVGPSKTALIYYLLPAFSAVQAIIFLGEPLRLLHVISFVLIIGGVLIATRVKG